MIMDNWTLFAFPLNLILALLWMFVWWILWKNHGKSILVRFMLSPAATVSSVALLLLCSLWIGFSGKNDFVTSIPFVLLLLYIQTVLYLVSLRRWKTPGGVVRWRFLLIHVGLLLALGSAFWGYPDSSESRVVLGRGDVARDAYEPEGGVRILPYSVYLHDFRTEYDGNGAPSEYSAVISIDEGSPVQITVNHPLNVGFGEDIYLASISDDHCILQIVREPWRYFAIAGILMLLAGAFMLFIKGPVK